MAATIFCASICPEDVSTTKPPAPLRVTDVTSTPQRTGASTFRQRFQNSAPPHRGWRSHRRRYQQIPAPENGHARRAIGDETVPSGCAPAFGNPVFFKDDMVDALIAEMCAHSKTCLPGADNNCVCLFCCHRRKPFKPHCRIGHPASRCGQYIG